ncbi:hypothetical protein INT45_011582 [Circinella minor]|uniref:Non-homologous end-joining factor 1 n=1 Tax=Circinella minor TaxID=1195481 RepID=A0A8H7VKX8_9FUNG|nr:hypothetical protein INT45_011582 [Circinella minor]
MNQETNNQLLKAPWYSIIKKPSTINDKNKDNNDNNNNNNNNERIYYIKYHIGDTDYQLLVTDLQRVWYNAANAQDLYKEAKEHRLVIDNKQQLKQLLKQLEKFLQSLENNCEIVEKEHELKIACSSQQGFATLRWAFLCKPLSSTSKKTSSLLDAPTVLYNQFILPMLMLVQNHPDIQHNDDNSFEKTTTTQLYPLKESWLKGMQQASINIAQNKYDEKSSSSPTPPPQSIPTTPDHPETNSNMDTEQKNISSSTSLSQQQTDSVPSTSQQHPRPKKRRMFS